MNLTIMMYYSSTDYKWVCFQRMLLFTQTNKCYWLVVFFSAYYLHGIILSTLYSICMFRPFSFYSRIFSITAVCIVNLYSNSRILAFVWHCFVLQMDLLSYLKTRQIAQMPWHVTVWGLNTSHHALDGVQLRGMLSVSVRCFLLPAGLLVVLQHLHHLLMSKLHGVINW